MTKTEQVLEVLASRIASGELAPGERLDIEALAAELGASTAPVREAVRRLAARGWVSSSGSRSAGTCVQDVPEGERERFTAEARAATSGDGPPVAHVDRVVYYPPNVAGKVSAPVAMTGPAWDRVQVLAGHHRVGSSEMVELLVLRALSSLAHGERTAIARALPHGPVRSAWPPAVVVRPAR